MKVLQKSKLRSCIILLLALTILVGSSSTVLASSKSDYCSGYDEAIATADNAIKYGELGEQIVNVIIDALKQVEVEFGESLFIGSNTPKLIKNIAISRIEKMIVAEENTQLVRSFGFDPVSDKTLLANELYDTACIYHDNGSNANAIKLSIIELIRFAMVQKLGYTETDAPAAAEYYYELYAIAASYGNASAYDQALADWAVNHEFSEWSTVNEATCEIEGQKRRNCRYCDAIETEVIAKVDHNWGEWITTEPTCETDGETHRSCNICGASESNTIPATGHTYVLVFSEEDHWTECACGLQTVMEEHIDNDGDGSCDTCSYQKNLGDADGDGTVDSYDARLILQYDVGAINATQLFLSVCDVDGDGLVDSYDARLILQYDVGAIEVFPVEE